MFLVDLNIHFFLNNELEAASLQPLPGDWALRFSPAWSRADGATLPFLPDSLPFGLPHPLPVSAPHPPALPSSTLSLTDPSLLWSNTLPSHVGNL